MGTTKSTIKETEKQYCVLIHVTLLFDVFDAFAPLNVCRGLQPTAGQVRGDGSGDACADAPHQGIKLRVAEEKLGQTLRSELPES